MDEVELAALQRTATRFAVPIDAETEPVLITSGFYARTLLAMRVKVLGQVLAVPFQRIAGMFARFRG